MPDMGFVGAFAMCACSMICWINRRKDRDPNIDAFCILRSVPVTFVETGMIPI